MCKIQLPAPMLRPLADVVCVGLSCSVSVNDVEGSLPEVEVGMAADLRTATMGLPVTDKLSV